MLFRSWDTIQLDEREFFKTKCPEIAEISKQNQRRLKIKSLKTENLDLHSQYSKMMLKTKKEVNFIKLSPFYRNSSHGNLTTYPMFIERIANILAPNGFFSVICPTTFLLSDNLKEFVKLFIQNNALNSYFDFENKKIFPIDSRFHFLITSGLNPFIKHPYQKILASFMQESPNRVLELIQKKETITNSNDLFLFEPEDYTLFNPNTGNSPVFNSRLDYEILKRIYNKVPILLKKGQNSEINSYKINTTRMYHLSEDSHFFINTIDLLTSNRNKEFTFRDKNNEIYFPLYEGKMLDHYNHRNNSSIMGAGKKLKGVNTKSEQYKDVKFEITPMYWVAKKNLEKKLESMEIFDKRNWFILYRSVTSKTNWRTLISSICPKTAVGNTALLVLSPESPKRNACLVSNFNCFIFDYIVRQKFGGTFLFFFILYQLPVFPPDFYSDSIQNFILSRDRKSVV